MKQKPSNAHSKRVLGLSALAAVLVVAVAVDQANQPTSDSVRKPSNTRHIQTATAPAAASDGSVAARPLRQIDPEVLFNPFGGLGAVKIAVAPAGPAVAAQKPASTPAPAVISAAPIPPTAPPLPFTAVGLIAGPDVTGGRPIAFLQQQEQVLLVKVGDDIAKTYRVESISAQRIEFTFLPLQQRQVLTLAQ